MANTDRISPDAFEEALISWTIVLPVAYMAGDLSKQLLGVIQKRYEGKCVKEGYVIPGSSKLLSYSGPVVAKSDVRINVAVECRVCNPVQGMVMSCRAKSITQTAGVRAELPVDRSPIVFYLARDQHIGREDFAQIKVGDLIRVKILGVRFELNDKYVSVIAELTSDSP